MNQKFEGSIGQVAGRDVKTNSAQSSVNVHIHNGPGDKYVSAKQRNAIARKAYEIEAKTQTDRLMVYRRLMTVFKFSSMDEMPRDVFPRAMSYLNGWLRNGTTEQVAKVPHAAVVAATTPKEIADSVETLPSPPALMLRPDGPAGDMHSAPTQVSGSRRGIPNRIRIAAVVVIALSASGYFVVNHVRAVGQVEKQAAGTQCEYGGDRYSIGSVVLQAGLRQKCVALADHGAGWQPLTPSGRR